MEAQVEAVAGVEAEAEAAVAAACMGYSLVDMDSCIHTDMATADRAVE